MYVRTYIHTYIHIYVRTYVCKYGECAYIQDIRTYIRIYVRTYVCKYGECAYIQDIRMSVDVHMWRWCIACVHNLIAIQFVLKHKNTHYRYVYVQYCMYYVYPSTAWFGILLLQSSASIQRQLRGSYFPTTKDCRRRNGGRWRRNQTKRTTWRGDSGWHTTVQAVFCVLQSQ